jgi:hypothetical protein
MSVRTSNNLIFLYECYPDKETSDTPCYERVLVLYITEKLKVIKKAVRLLAAVVSCRGPGFNPK